MIRTDLIRKLKNYLDITWEDDLTESKIQGILMRAVSILKSYAGIDSETDLELEEGSDEEQLLLDLCRYIYNNAYEDFKINFLSELIMLREKYKCKLESEDDEQKESSNI